MVRESDESLGTERRKEKQKDVVNEIERKTKEKKEKLKDVITKIVCKRKLSVFHNDVSSKESVQILTVCFSNLSWSCSNYEGKKF